MMMASTVTPSQWAKHVNVTTKSNDKQQGRNTSYGNV